MNSCSPLLPPLPRCFDTSFPRGALVYHHPLFQRDRPELMSKMSAGMNKFARHGVEETLTSSRATEDRHPRIAAHLGQVSRFVPSNPTALASYGLTTVERLGDICPQQPQQLQLHSQLLAAERLRAAATTIRARMQSQVTVRDLCLQRLQESQGSAVVPSDPSYLQYLATRGSGALAADQMFGSQVVPAADVDLSSLSILRLLQVRELLSRARGPS